MSLKDSLDPDEYIAILEEEMYKAASELRFEDAAKLRDEIFRVKAERKVGR